jgi:hypothetical protein
MPNTRFMPNLLKCGTADSTKEAMTIAVKITKIKSRKNHIRKIDRPTKATRIIVPVVIEM